VTIIYRGRGLAELYRAIYIYILYTRLRYLCLSLTFLFDEKCHIENRRRHHHHSSKVFGGDIKIFRGHMRIPRAGIIVILYSRSMYIYYIIIYVSEMLIKKNKIKIITRRIKRNIFSNSSHVFGRRTGSSHRYRYNVIYKYINIYVYRVIYIYKRERYI